MISPIYKNNKIIGYIDSINKIYISDRTRAHVFNIHRGFGISVSVLDLLSEQDINLIMIRIEGFELITNRDTFLVKGISYNDLGDEQLILPIEYFNKKISQEHQGVLA